MRTHKLLYSVLFILLPLACKVNKKVIKASSNEDAFFAKIEPNLWQAIGPFGAPNPITANGQWSAAGSGRFESILLNSENENEIFLGHASSGLFKTTDGGKTWQQKLNFEFATGIFDMIRFRKNEKHIIACCATDLGAERQYGYGLIESFDNGETWQRNSLQYNPSEYNYTQQRAIAIVDKKGEQKLISITNHDIYVSNDGAKTWLKVFTTVENLKSIKVNPEDDENIIVTGNVLLVTYDGGLNWLDETARLCTAYGSAPGPYARYEVQFSKKDKQKLWIAVSHNSSYLLTVDTHLKDIKLQSKSQYTANLYHMCLSSELIGTSEILYIGTTRLFKSVNDGASFTQISRPDAGVSNQAHDDVNSLTLKLNGVIYMTTDGGADISLDKGNTWRSITNQSSNLNAALVFGFDKNKVNEMMAGTQDKGIFVFNKRKWLGCDLYGDGGRVVAMGDSNAFACGYAKMCYVTKDHGESFDYNHAGDEINFFDFRMYYSENFKNLFIANHHLYKQNEGKNFEILTSTLTTERPIGAFWVNKENNDEIWLSKLDATWGAPLLKKLYYTNDGGATWIDKTEALPILKWRAITDIDVNDAGDIAITLNGFDNAQSEELNKVYVSKDGGNTFENMSTGLGNYPVYTIEPVGNTWVCGNANGIFVKTRNENWQKLGEGFPTTIVSEIKYFEDQRMLYVSTFGRGLWRIWLN